MSFFAEVSARILVEAAHRMPHFPKGHPNERLHGHTFTIEVSVVGEVSSHTGMVVDHGDLESALCELREQLDHRYLNDVVGLELPTSENLGRWFWERLAPRFSGLNQITVSREQRGIQVIYRGPDFTPRQFVTSNSGV